MSIESRDILKTYFETGDVPTQDQFYSLIDSYVHRTDDGVTVYEPVPGEKRFGIGVLMPANRLGVKATGTNEATIGLYSSNDSPIHEWSLALKPGDDSNRGLAFEHQTALGPENRMFIQGSTGYVGIGTILPVELLHLENSAPGDITGTKMLNLASVANEGWNLGHKHDVDATIDGALSFRESDPALGEVERMVIAHGGKVGINTNVPDTLLHVVRDVADAGTDLDLVEGTGILVLGPMTDNLVADYRGLQARHGEFIGSVLDITASTLNFQRLGGDILIHGDETFDDSIKGIVTAEALMGLGTLTPAERIDIAGAIKIGTSLNENDGTIRFTGTDFEGRVGGGWVSLTSSSPGTDPWTVGPDGIYYTGATPRVAIGMDINKNALTVYSNETVAAGSTAMHLGNNSSTSSTDPNDSRIGIQVDMTGIWGGSDRSKNVGIMVSRLTGQPTNETNIAGAFNGNLVIGSIPGDPSVIGTNGQNVLAIQPSSSPSSVPDFDAIQIYAQDVAGHGVFYIMNGNGDTMSLFKGAALTTVDSDPFAPDYNTDVITILDNMRNRINDLEARLQAFGLLA